MDYSDKRTALFLIKSFICMVLLGSSIVTSFTAKAQSFDISLSLSGDTDPGDTVTITMTVTCNDTIRCRLGNYPNPNADGMITVTGNATPGLFDIPQQINRFGFFSPGQSKSRSVDITLTGMQGDVISIEAFADGYCRANDSNGPGGADTREINCDDTETITLVTTPVTLSSVSSERIGDAIKIDWGTSSELFNVGFQLWGLDGTDSKWEKLHGWLIRSGSGNAVESQSYTKTVPLPGSISELVAVGISSVDNDGSEHYYGPFDVGQSYGNLSTLKPIAWDHIRSQVDAQMLARGYVKDRLLGYRKVSTASSASADTQSVVEFRVNEAGMYRITAQDLLAAGVDWREVSRRDIALIDHRGEAVVRTISAKGSGYGYSKTLGAGGELYFYASGVDARSGLYSESRVYRLVVDRYRALASQYQSKRGVSGDASEFYRTTRRVENDRRYTLNSKADDPWLDTVILSHNDQPTSYAASVEVDGDALWSHDAQVRLDLSSSSALPGVDADGDGVQDAEHMLEAVVLSSQGVGGLLSLGTDAAVGSGVWRPQFTIPGGSELSLVEGKAVLGGLFKAGAGYGLSEVHVDAVELSYARPYVARSDDDYLAFRAPDDGAQNYRVRVPDRGWPMVFAYSDEGALVRLSLESQQRQVGVNGEALREVRFAALDGALSGSVEYWVSGKGGLLSVEGLSSKLIVSSSSLLTQALGSNLLVVSHPAFMTDELLAYADFKRSQGYGVSVINYLEVVDAFGGGQSGPMGLTSYLSAVQAQSSAFKHVLLVGGSSYDHTDKLGTGAMTFIPGHYGESGHSQYTVTDSPYVTDAQGTLFASIGRWPVRSESDLSTIIAHSRQWSSTDRSSGRALALAEHTIAGEEIDFGSALDGVVSQLPGNWSTRKVYVDEIRSSDPGLSLPQALVEAKAQLVSGLESGVDVVLYNGHGTTSQLSNKGLFKAGDVAGIDSGSAQLWMPMSCYMTYYESTHKNTLAHQLLFSGKAVGITGAMLLSNQSENIAGGKAILAGSVSQGSSIGEAMTAHKRLQSNSSLNVNLTHLGDPTLKM